MKPLNMEDKTYKLLRQIAERFQRILKKKGWDMAILNITEFAVVLGDEDGTIRVEFHEDSACTSSIRTYYPLDAAKTIHIANIGCGLDLPVYFRSPLKGPFTVASR